MDSPTQNGAIVRVHGVHKFFRRGNERLDVLNGVTLDVPEGEFLGLMGPSGSGKTTLLGPIDPSGVLHEGSVEDVEKACREAIEVLAPGGGFILGPGCALPATTPAANIDKLVECAKVYGKY